LKALVWLYVKLRGRVQVTDSNEAQQEFPSAEELREGYPTLAKILRGILNDPDIPDEGVERLDVNAFANGTATYRVWIRGADEHQGGYLDQL
jgi:hypothetical protein